MLAQWEDLVMEAFFQLVFWAKTEHTKFKISASSTGVGLPVV
jgi:hypothetical protein